MVRVRHINLLFGSSITAFVLCSLFSPFRYLRDRLGKMSSTGKGNSIMRALQTVGMSELETSIIKATYSDGDAPKAKHVELLINSCALVPILFCVTFCQHGRCWPISFTAASLQVIDLVVGCVVLVAVFFFERLWLW